MKPQIATTPEQSKRLLACGVKPETADMCYSSGALSLMEYRYEIKDRDSRRENYEIIPAWSLSCLLSLLPHSILAENEDEEFNDYDLFIYPSATGKKWEIDYAFTDDFVCERVFECSDFSLIEVCTRTIEWLTSHGYSLNNIEQ